MTRRASPPNVGKRLIAARLQRGLAQVAVARSAGLAPSYLSRIENGKIQPTFPTVMKIVGVLGADPAEILGPDAPLDKPRGPCPVTTRGQCLLDVIRREPDPEHFTPREIRLIRRFTTWIKSARPDRLRAMEILLDDLQQATGEESG